MDKNANQLDFKFTAFNSSMQLCMLHGYKYVLAEYLKYKAFKGIVFFGTMWEALKRAGFYVVAFGCYVNCACVLQLFQQFFSGNSSVNLFAVYLFKNKLFIKILSSSLNTTFIVNKHCSDICCDEFRVPQIDHNSKNIKICLHFLPHMLNICQKIDLFISQGSVVTCLRWGGHCRMRFVANFMRFPAVRKVWKLVKIWQSYREFKGGNFFETQCRNTFFFQLTFYFHKDLTDLHHKWSTSS